MTEINTTNIWYPFSSKPEGGPVIHRIIPAIIGYIFFKIFLSIIKSTNPLANKKQTFF